MARPKTTDRELVRTVVLTVRIRPDQRKRWESRAKQAGVPMAQWIRTTLDRAVRTG